MMQFVHVSQTHHNRYNIPIPNQSTLSVGYDAVCACPSFTTRSHSTHYSTLSLCAPHLQHALILTERPAPYDLQFFTSIMIHASHNSSSQHTRSRITTPLHRTEGANHMRPTGWKDASQSHHITTWGNISKRAHPAATSLA